MEMVQLAQTGGQSLGSTAGAAILGIIALIIAWKVVKFILKLVFSVVGLALLGVAVWWLTQAQ